MSLSSLLSAISRRREVKWEDTTTASSSLFVDIGGIKDKLTNIIEIPPDMPHQQPSRRKNTRAFTEACEDIADQAFSDEVNVFRRKAFHDAGLAAIIVSFANDYLDEKMHDRVDYIDETYVCDVVCRAFIQMSVFYKVQDVELNKEIFDIDIHCDKTLGYNLKLFESGVCDILVRILRRHHQCIEVTHSVCGAIVNMAFDECNDFKSKLGQLGCCEILARALDLHMKIMPTVERILSAIWALSDCMENSVKFGNCGTCELLIQSMTRYFNKYDLMKTSVLIVGIFANDNEVNKLLLGQLGCCELLMAVLQTYMEYKSVAVHACNSILHLTSCERNKNTFNDIAILDLMLVAKNTYPDELHHTYYQTLAVCRFQNTLLDPDSYSDKIPKHRQKASSVVKK